MTSMATARGKHAKKAAFLALGALFVAVACSGEDGSGPPAAGCPQGFCAPGPICAEGCNSPCGCCGCEEGATYQYKGMPHVCKNGCFAPGGSIVDASTDITQPQDAAQDVLDCEAQGCGDQICGQECSHPCGCCTCIDFETKDIGGALHTCIAGCWQPPA